jgi:hypothetical protein
MSSQTKKTPAPPPAKKKKVVEPAADQVFKPPVITRQPSNRSAVLGTRCFLQVSAQGIPMPKYQWFHNGRPLAGAMGSRMFIPKMRQSNVGNYTCEVKNLVGSVMSKQVSITLVQAQIPDFKVIPATLSVKLGERAQFKIEFAGAKPLNLHGYDIQWYCNGRKIRGADKEELDIKHCVAALQGELAVKITLKVNTSAYKISPASQLVVIDGKARVAQPKANAKPVQETAKPVATKIAPPAKAETKVAPITAAAPQPIAPQKLPTKEDKQPDDSFFSFGQDPIPSPALNQKKKVLESALVQLKKYRRANKLKSALAKLAKIRSRRAPSKAS